MDAVVETGQTILGKYRVERVLGVGGMGVVVAAHHLELDDRVAIKFLLPETLSNDQAVARFVREARAAVRIKSEHVARVSDVGKLENGAPYMVMEYLEGSDLSDWLSTRGPLPVEQAVDFVLQASEAIAEAHVLGIVHRDLKPANLFAIRRPDGSSSIKVLDFGISKVTSLGGSGGEGSMTRTSTMMGSPSYMSPEQIQSSRDVDCRADIWALGVILYELLSGQVPFGGQHIAELIYAIMSSEPAPLRALRPDVPIELEACVMRCLAKQRERRFSSVAAMATTLLAFGSRRAATSVERIGAISGDAPALREQKTLPLVAPVPAAPVLAEAAGSAPGGPMAFQTAASWGNTALGQKPRPWLWVGVGGGALGLAALALLPHLLEKSATAPGSQLPTGAQPEAVAAPASVALPSPAAPRADASLAPSPATSSTPATLAASPAAPSSAPVPSAPGAHETSAPAGHQPSTVGVAPPATRATARGNKPVVAPATAAPAANTNPWGEGQL